MAGQKREGRDSGSCPLTHGVFWAVGGEGSVVQLRFQVLTHNWTRVEEGKREDGDGDGDGEKRWSA